MATVIISPAGLFALCAMLSLSLLGGALADPALKSPIIGLISTGSSGNTLDEFKGREGILGGVVVQATWADLEPYQPLQGASPLLSTSVIDAALTAVRNYNATVANKPSSNNRQLDVRLRIFAGCTASGSDAPAWALNLDGGAVTITAPYDGVNETCTLGHFWDLTSGYGMAWRQFQTALAAKYDAEPLIHEVSMTSCTSFSAEPFFLAYPSPTSAPAQFALEQTTLGNAGYTDTKYQQCLTNAISDYNAWQTTRVEFSFNGFYGLTTQNNIVVSDQIMRACRLAAGLRCILSNHDLDTGTPSTILPVYALIRKFGPNITFQSYHTTPPDLEGVIRKGISLGAGAIEIWPASFRAVVDEKRSTLTNATLESWASMFEPQ
jgi:hypothetical protein